MKKELEDVKQLIFEGFLYDTITLNGVSITLRTLYEHERKEIIGYQATDNSSFNLKIIIKTIAKSIIEVNHDIIQNNNLLEIVEQFNLRMVIVLYDFYKIIYDRVEKCFENYKEFFESNESRYRWITFKRGYTFHKLSLNGLQEAWINYNENQDKIDDFNVSRNLSDYVISHVTHATINPKSYVQRMKTEKASEGNDENLDNSGRVDLNSDLKENLLRHEKETDEQYNIRLREFMQNKLDGKDDHDDIVANMEVEKFRTLLRQRKLKLNKDSEVKPTVVVSNKLKVGEKIEVTMENETLKKKIENNPYFHNNIDYTDILSYKAFANIDKDLIFKQIMEEPDTEKIYNTNMEQLKNAEEALYKRQVNAEDEHDRLIREYEEKRATDAKPLAEKKIETVNFEKRDIKVGYRQNSESVDVVPDERSKMKLKDLLQGDIKNMKIKNLNEMEDKNGK